MRFYRYIFIFFLAAGLNSSLVRAQQLEHQNNSQEVWITIFVHGIMNVQPHLTLPNIINFWYDNVENSAYYTCIQLLRNDPFFQQYHAMQGLGLQKIDTTLKGPGFASSALATTINMLSAYSATTIPGTINRINHYYTFGWSGLFSSKARHHDAHLLYDALAHEIQLFTDHGIKPHIRLIGYSQGGNVVINLGVIHSQKQNSHISIDQLVLVGVPLIKEDYEGIGSPLFKTVYNFYSFGDHVQPIDCLSGGIGLSGRLFKSTGTFRVPQHLKQIQYRIKRIAYQNPLEKPPKKFHKRLLRPADPGHTELWSFGWVHHYRPYFPFYPLPAVAFIPYIIDCIEHHLANAQYVTVDIRPFEETIKFVDQKKRRSTYKTHFFTYDELQQIRTVVEAYRPLNFTKQIFDKKTDQAIAQSQVMNKTTQDVVI